MNTDYNFHILYTSYHRITLYDNDNDNDNDNDIVLTRNDNMYPIKIADDPDPKPPYSYVVCWWRATRSSQSMW